MPISEKVIRDKLSAAEIDFTVHAIFEVAEDLLFVDEIEAALTRAEILEDDEDRLRCLLCAPLVSGGFVHAVVEYADWKADSVSHLVIITVYRPDPARWIDGRIRKP